MQMLRSDSGSHMNLRRRATVCFTDDAESRRKSIGSIEARKNTLELGSLKEDCEMLKKKLEKKVQENVDLKQQMVEMVSEHDADKQSTLDR